MYRNDWEAAVARATALENELRQAQQSHSQDQSLISNLTMQLEAARAELARLQQGAQPSYAPYMPVPQYMYPSRGGTILALGILSLVVCAILGPIAWAMGNEELRRIAAGQTPPDAQGNVTGGRICGIIGTVLMILGVIFVIFAFVIGAMAESQYHHHY